MAQPQAAAEKPSPLRLTHKHTNDERYQNSCKACRAEDAERSKPGVRSISEDELVRTTFLIPETAYDNSVCRAYIASKYPDAQYIGSQLNLATISGWPAGEKIVVVRRDTWPKLPGPSMRKELDEEEGKRVYVDIPPETYISECVESAPLDVHSTMVATAADRFTKAKLDLKPLVARLSELMPPPYRIDLPRHERDSEARFVHA